MPLNLPEGKHVSAPNPGWEFSCVLSGKLCLGSCRLGVRRPLSITAYVEHSGKQGRASAGPAQRRPLPPMPAPSLRQCSSSSTGPCRKQM